MLLFHTQNLKKHGLESVFRLAKEAGFSGIEVNVAHNFDTQNPEYLKELSQRYDLQIKAFSMYAKQEEKLLKPFQETAKQFPGSTLNLHTPDNLSFTYKSWTEKIAPKLAKKYGLTLNWINRPTKPIMGFFSTSGSNSLESLRSKGGVCVDLSSLGQEETRITNSIKTLGSHLRHVYLSDIVKGKPYGLPGQGILELRDFLTRLATKGFTGDISLRISGEALGQDDPQTTLNRMIAAREFYEKYFVAETTDEI